MSYNKGSFFERQLKHLLEAKGFYVVRASGSGVDGVSPDLIVLHTTKRFALECKAWKNSLSLDATKVRIMKEWESTTGLPIYIAWKSPRKEWRFFPLMALSETNKAFALNKNMLETGMTLEEMVA